jgi:hypothetical protein
MHSLARFTARRIRSLASPSGRRVLESRNPEVCSRGQRQPEQSGESLDTLSELQNLVPKFRLCDVRDVDTDHNCRRRSEPPTRRRARNAEIRGDGRVPSASDEIPEPMVIALLRARRRFHATDHRHFVDTAQLLTGMRSFG